MNQPSLLTALGATRRVSQPLTSAPLSVNIRDMKFNTGNWVIVTKRREGGPDIEAKGKIIEATPDYAVAECWINGSKLRFTMSDDTFGSVFFRKATHSDFRRRR